MDRVIIGLTTLSAAGVLGIFSGRGAGGDLKPGDKAPDFALVGSDGKTYKLSDFVGKRAVVLAWFPKAFTPGCTTECKSLRTGGGALRAFDAAYFTASRDTPARNAEFAKSLGLDYPILSDPEGKVAKAYGVTDAVHRWARRWTFYIGADGKILAIDKKVNPETHAADVARRLAELGVPLASRER
ncbi:MAG: peroxiredoxin [Pirellulales bacterium]|nr:peroxiredoxin [Pirellulales bacterium]